MIKHSKIIFISLFIMLLSSCHWQDDNNTDLIASNIPSKVLESKESISELLPKTVATTTCSEDIPMEILSEEAGEVAFLSIFPFLDNTIFSSILWGIPSYYSLYINESFIELVGEKEYEAWLNEFQIKSSDWSEKDVALRKDVCEFSNLFSFIYDFNLSEVQVRKALLEWNEFGVTDYFSKYVYSDEEITALATRDKSAVIKLFANPTTIIKNNKFYSPGWFFYSALDDYKNCSITAQDLLFILQNCKKDGDPLATLYFYDLVELKAYYYLDRNVDVIELCGYDRDFNMPLAYEYFLSNHMESYDSFYNHCYDGMCSYDIIKEGNIYSPHWVYYNKPVAYKEAGITGDELVEMLPKYKELGILSEEAYKALEEKIYAYAESFEG